MWKQNWYVYLLNTCSWSYCEQFFCARHVIQTMFVWRLFALYLISLSCVNSWDIKNICYDFPFIMVSCAVLVNHFKVSAGLNSTLQMNVLNRCRKAYIFDVMAFKNIYILLRILSSSTNLYFRVHLLEFKFEEWKMKSCFLRNGTIWSVFMLKKN